jgi:hypothetical protein
LPDLLVRHLANVLRGRRDVPIVELVELLASHVGAVAHLLQAFVTGIVVIERDQQLAGPGCQELKQGMCAPAILGWSGKRNRGALVAKITKLHVITDDGVTEIRIGLFTKEELGLSEEDEEWGDPEPEGLDVFWPEYEVYEN